MACFLKNLVLYESVLFDTDNIFCRPYSSRETQEELVDSEQETQLKSLRIIWNQPFSARDIDSCSNNKKDNFFIS
jgi:hypothetical protein